MQAAAAYAAGFHKPAKEGERKQAAVVTVSAVFSTDPIILKRGCWDKSEVAKVVSVIQIQTFRAINIL